VKKAARERAAELAKANEALLGCLDSLASVPELDEFLGQVMGREGLRRRLVPIVVVEILSLLVGAGLISLALNPVPVEEQPVASYAPQVLFGLSAGCFST
jgi:hypothetical protein